MGVLGRISNRSTEFLFSFLSRNGFASLAAFFFFLTLHKVKGGKIPTREGHYRILMLSRVVFKEDVL
jgi:hypothetical protein